MLLGDIKDRADWELAEKAFACRPTREMIVLHVHVMAEMAMSLIG
jgi:hypothetical protein